MKSNVVWFENISKNDLALVGGKNSSLGEMITNLTAAGVKVPGGFATTADAFRQFLLQNNLQHKIATTLAALDVNNVTELAKVGQQIRQSIIATPFLADFTAEIRQCYKQLSSKCSPGTSFAIRSSATAEDLPEASFAGQQETYLNISGIDNVFDAIKKVFASLYNDRAIAYRVHHNFAHADVAISVGIQQMIRSDLGASGVIFSLDTESGFDQVVFITASYGLGEPIVQGEVNPDEFYVFKPNLQKNCSAILRRNLGSKLMKMTFADNNEQGVIKVKVPENESLQYCLTDAEVELLAQQAMLIEEHYGKPMDIEWAKDGHDHQLYILQARPETVKSHLHKQQTLSERYVLQKPGKVIVSGRSVGQKIGSGMARVIMDVDHMHELRPGEVLVTEMTDPDWEPVMKIASAIVTNRGGRTCHAAIVARELGISAVVGCGEATKLIKDRSAVTVSCAEGDTGYVYEGLLKYDIIQATQEHMPKIPFKMMLNVANPDRAFGFSFLPNAGVGLARLEFIINQMIGIHPQAVLKYHSLSKDLQRSIHQKTCAYGDPVEFYIEKLKEGIATIAAAFYPKPVIVRLSDFKTNEYANLFGGADFEPHEENPMIGFRGASRYVHELFSACFELECRALKRVRNDMQLTNVYVMVPFVRTVTEAKNVIAALAENDLVRGERELKIIMMCEVPSNAILAEQFLEYFDGFSIGSNDLTQLTLGIDRDSEIVAKQFDERDPAVKQLMHQAIVACNKANKYIGICGQGPSDHPDLAKWLMEEGIESISLNPDTVVDTWLFLGKIAQENQKK